MTEVVYTEEIVPPFYAFDFAGNMKISSLIDTMILASEHQLHAGNAGSDDMVEKGFGWVVVQYHMDIIKMPQKDQKLVVSTQAESYNKFFLYRNFWIDDEEGNRLVTLESSFVILDINQRKIISAAESLDNFFGAEQTSKIKRFARLPKVSKDESDNNRDQHIGYYNIDINGHVNNSYYFDWMLDSLDMEFLSSHQVGSVDIKYEKELDIDSTPTVYSTYNPEDMTSIHWIESDNQENVIAKISWEDIPS
ncbi:acyl-[acyl-carrier-protein] thioesterase [Companilactobacillus metriopterae]|uniref:acyl-[acyl-carrier-protein] thioesterase n=1 Tax=Companilactobacillus metriopterae TaxID=1909267 RepID=UPI00100B775C|nr:acyl-ACP thioesterase domain-containing protein [Companilactobacillus metriopterae]